MRLLSLLALPLAACASAVDVPSMPSSQGLEMSVEPGVVQFFRAHSGSDQGCSDCVLLAVPNSADGDRVALFVEPESSCSLRSSDVEEAGGRPFEGQFGVQLLLRDSGMAEIAACAGRARHEDDTPRFLVTLNGDVVGTEWVHDYETENNLILLIGGPEYERIYEALRPPENPTMEL